MLMIFFIKETGITQKFYGIMRKNFIEILIINNIETIVKNITEILVIKLKLL